MAKTATGEPRAPYLLATVPLWVIYAVTLGVPLGFIGYLMVTSTGAGNPVSLIIESGYGEVILRTIEISLIVTAVCAVVGFPFAYLISSAGPALRRVLIVCVAFPYWTSIVVRAFGWHIVLTESGKALDWLSKLGVVSEYTSLERSRFGLVVGLVQTELPLMILSALVVLRQLDRRLFDAASTCGANGFRRMRTVVLPLASPGVIVGAILVFTSTMGSYVVPQLLGGLGDTMIGQVIVQEATGLLDWPVAGLLSACLIVVQLLGLGLLQLVGARNRRIHRR